MSAACHFSLKGGPEPLEKEIPEMLGSKREDRFSDPFFDLVQNTGLVRFSCLLRLCNFCKAPRDAAKVPAEVPEDSLVLRVRRLWFPTCNVSIPGLSPLERPGLDNITSQTWSDATCPCITSSSAYFPLSRFFLFEKTRQSTRSGGTGAGCVRPWLICAMV